jgi:serine/threonine protein kinase
VIVFVFFNADNVYMWICVCVLLFSERTLNEEQIAIVLKQSLYGLEYLHSKRKIHRDVSISSVHP